MDFRARDFAGEDEAHSLPRVATYTHPLSPSPLPPTLQVDLVHQKNDFFDPLRAVDAHLPVSIENLDDEVNKVSLDNTDSQFSEKEWTSFKKLLMQKFSCPKMVSLSTKSDVITTGGKVHEKDPTPMHLEENSHAQKFTEEGIKFISQQEYISRLHLLKDEISRAWQADDRVTSLKLSTKVARLLMDTSALHFYPTLFVLATDLFDMLGEMVWQRIRQKAEISADAVCTMPGKFEAKYICTDAKETCFNWFSKIGSVHELLPRIYLELAILPCWSFLLDQPIDVLLRLAMMARGVADPLAAAYCHLYIARCAQKLRSCGDTGYLFLCIDNIKVLLMRHLQENDPEKSRLFVNLMEPAISYIVKCLVKDAFQGHASYLELEPRDNLSKLLGKSPSISIILHHILKEIPTELVTSAASEILQHIQYSKDSSFDQCLNYRLLGFRLSERRYQFKEVNEIVNKVIETFHVLGAMSLELGYSDIENVGFSSKPVVSSIIYKTEKGLLDQKKKRKVVYEYDSLDNYLKVVEAYLDMILQNQMDNNLNIILDSIVKRARSEAIVELDFISLQSILVKLIDHFSNLEDVFSLPQFFEILHMMHGSSRDIVNMHILNLATRKGCICDPTIIQLLFEISQSLYNGVDVSNMKDDNQQQSAHLISCFVNMVDHGPNLDRHLAFLVDCRGAFGSMYELKESLVHSSNRLAVNAMKDGRDLSLVKSCLAFSEVTIPSVSSCAMQLNLFLETAEVALLCGLVSHSDGLLKSAIICLQALSSMDGSRLLNDADGIIQLLRKLCSLLVLVPGKPEQGVTSMLRSIVAAINLQSWVTTKMRTRMLCGIISLAATLSQPTLPYHLELMQSRGRSLFNCGTTSSAFFFLKIPSNDDLFFGDLTYLQELQSFSALVFQDIVDLIMQEPSLLARGHIALEVCNCIVSSFNLNGEVLLLFSKLMETAKSCLSSNDRYLQATLKFAHKFMLKT